jgi:antirestriction protein ArdC
MKGYTVFNVEQLDGLPAHYYAQPENPLLLSDGSRAPTIS